jgi:ribosomal-protein-alanine acetyltransferase
MDDLETIVELEQRLFPDDAWPRQMLRDEIEGSQNVMLVAEDDRGIIGYAAAQALTGNDIADVHNIAIVESARGKGLGAQLFDALIEWCRARGATAFMLEVRADNEVAQSLYRSRGFDAIAVRPGYYQPAGVDAIVMRREDRA